jgi:hypothetical protein
MPKPCESLDPKLKEWATPRQAEYVDAVIKYRGIRAAARKLGVDLVDRRQKEMRQCLGVS